MESIDAVRGMFAVGSCRVGLDEVDILGEFRGEELEDEAPLRNGSLTVLAVAVVVGRECERGFARAAAAPFSAISSFSASAAAASRISSRRGSGATLLDGFGALTRSVEGEVESATMVRPWACMLRLVEGDEGGCRLGTATGLWLEEDSCMASGLVGARTGSETVWVRCSRAASKGFGDSLEVICANADWRRQ